MLRLRCYLLIPVLLLVGCTTSESLGASSAPATHALPLSTPLSSTTGTTAPTQMSVTSVSPTMAPSEPPTPRSTITPPAVVLPPLPSPQPEPADPLTPPPAWLVAGDSGVLSTLSSFQYSVDRGAGETAYAVRDGGDPHAASNLASITLAPDAQSILVIGTPAVKEVQVTLGPWSARTDKPADQYSLTDGQVQGQVTVFRLHPISMAAEQLMQVFVRFAGAIHTDDYATYNWRLIPAAPLTRATLPPSRARPHILFVSGDSAGDSVLTILSEGRTHTLLRAPDHGVIDYSVSPDYRRVAGVISRANQWDIVVVNLDGTGTTMLTDDSALEQRPTWSPDGQTLAFVSTADPDTHCIQHTCYSDIYTINADGTNRRQLTTDPDADREPAWSPDGTHIAFLRGCVDIVKECTQVLYLMQADGRNQTSVLDAAGAPIREAFASTPSWSSDGQHIVVYIYRYGENGAFAIPVAGGLPIKLHAFIWTEGHATIYEYGFRRSADGARIAFIRQTGECQVEPCTRHIYVMNADGSSKRQLTYDGTENTSPAWSPDEQQILFVSNREGTWGIYTMDADGSHQQQLVQNVDGFSQPLWLP